MIREQEGEDVYPRLLVLFIVADRAFLRGLTNALRAVPVGLYRFAACSIHVAVNTRVKIKEPKRERQSNSLHLYRSL